MLIKGKVALFQMKRTGWGQALPLAWPPLDPISVLAEPKPCSPPCRKGPA
jgi:hypothetical protein